MLLNSIIILFLSELVSNVSSKNYTGHAVYKIHAKNLIRSHTDQYLDEDRAIILSNGSIPLPKDLQKLWQGVEANGDEYAVVHVERTKNSRFKRDLNYRLLTDDLNSWITAGYGSSNSIIAPLSNYGMMSDVKQEPYLSKSLDASNNFKSYLTPTYGSFWTLLQSPFKTLSQLTNWNSQWSGWNLLPVLSSGQMSSNPDNTISSSFQGAIPPKSNDEYKSSASSNTIRHISAAQEQAPVFLSTFIPTFRLDVYHNLDEIYDYLERITGMHKQMRIYTIGFSHEKRPIKAIEIHQDTQNLNTKMVYLDGLIHAREHITTASLLNIIEQILIRKIKCNFLIVPVINVDGYTYTWTTDRLWRKNRRKINSSNSLLNSLRTRFASEKCNGVDLNRNWRVNFGGVGSSLNPCSELYAGPHALSEPETSALARLLWDNRNRIRLFISLHSYGQLWAAPHSYTRAKSPHHDLHMSVLKEVQQAVFNVNNVLYNVGPLGSSLYLGSGYSLDYSYEQLNIVHSYLVEVRDKGEYGFLLPPDQILPTSFEVLEGILVSIKRAY